MTMLTEGGVASLLKTEGHFENIDEGDQHLHLQIVNIRRLPAK